MPSYPRLTRSAWPVAVAALLLGAVAAGWLLYLGDTSGNGSSSALGAHLRPLPPGPPTHVRFEARIQRETLGAMARKADVVVLARATAIGGSEVVSPSTSEGAPATTIHRTRFSVIRVFRGDIGSLVDVADFDNDAAYPFEVGHDYLVFAEWRALGSEQRRELTPVGYYQGIYQKVDDHSARNTINGSVDLDSLPGLLG